MSLGLNHEPAAHRTVAVIHQELQEREDSRISYGVLGGFTRLPAGTGIISHCFCSHAPAPAGEPFRASHWYQGNPGQGTPVITKTAGRLVTQVPPNLASVLHGGARMCPPLSQVPPELCHRLTMVFRWSCQRLL